MERVRLIRIGRAEDNDMVINDESISPYHLELFEDVQGKVYVSDLNTETGTYINGSRLEYFKCLTFGDKITIAGKFMFDWVKLANIQINNINFDSSTKNWICSENKSNLVHIPQEKVREITIESESESENLEIDEHADWKTKLIYFYTNNASIVHIFALNIVLFIMFYLAFLS